MKQGIICISLLVLAVSLVSAVSAADKISKDLIKLNNVRRRRGLKGAKDKGFSVWSRWGDWSECTRTCDGGVKYRTRHCMSRIPANNKAGLQTCEGDSRQYRSCNTKPCPPGTQDFREMQCAIYNEKPLVEWLPLEGGSKNECDLMCRTSDGAYVFNFRHVIDGTRCRRDSLDMCIEGKCQIVGCDGVLNSTAALDSCGVCGGRNQTCGHVHKTYSEEYPSTGFYTYNRIIMIPPGAKFIRIKDKSSLNFIALKDESGKFILNGDWTIDWPGNYEGAGANITYQRHRNGTEDIKMDGPTNKIIEVMLIFRERNPGVEYEYWTPPKRGSGNNLVKDQLLSDDILVEGEENPSVQTDSEVKHEPSSSSNATQIEDGEGLEAAEDEEEEEEGEVEGQDGESRKKPRKDKGKKKDKKKDKDRKKEKCPKCRKVRGSRKNHYCENDFVLHVEITSRAIMNGQTRYDATILQTFKNTVHLGRREFIWVPNVCKCPSLKAGGQYLVTGNRRYDPETGETQLVVDRNNLVSSWKDGYRKKWDKIQTRELVDCAPREEDTEGPTGRV